MNYRSKYIFDGLREPGIYKTFDYLNEHLLTETRHMIDEIPKISDDLFSISYNHIYNFIKGYPLPFDGTKPYYTGWNFLSTTDREMLSKKANKPTSEIEKYLKLNNKNIFHAVYIQLKQLDDMTVASVNLRVPKITTEELQNSINAQFEHDDITININVGYLYKYMLSKDQYNIFSIKYYIAHELYHSVEQYSNELINPYKNSNKKYGIVLEVDKNDLNLDTNSHLFKNIYQISYIISKEERSARLQ